MSSRRGSSLLVAALLLAGCRSHLSPEARQALQSRVAHGIIPGAAVVLIDAKGEYFEAFGSTRLDKRVPASPDSLFEIASLSKLFTGLVLADMVDKGEVSLDDPAEKWLKPAMHTPRFKGQTYTLWGLVTHRSGLPRDLGGYDSFDEDQLNAIIPNTPLVTAPGSTVAYSNYGIATLAKALADRAGKPFNELLRDRVNVPLGLQDTVYTLSPAQEPRFVQGTHDGAPIAPLALKAFAPAFGLKSSPRDLARFLHAQLGAGPSALAGAIELSHKQISMGEHPMAMAWMISQTAGGPALWHSGIAPGFRSFIAFRASDQRGVVVLSNSNASCEDIGWKLLDPRSKLEDWDSRATLSESALGQFCGRYQTEHAGILTLVRSGEGILAQVPGQNPGELEAQSPDELINAAAQVRVHFERDSNGKILRLDWNGLKATRLPD